MCNAEARCSCLGRSSCPILICGYCQLLGFSAHATLGFVAIVSAHARGYCWESVLGSGLVGLYVGAGHTRVRIASVEFPKQ